MLGKGLHNNMDKKLISLLPEDIKQQVIDRIRRMEGLPKGKSQTEISDSSIKANKPRETVQKEISREDVWNRLQKGRPLIKRQG